MTKHNIRIVFMGTPDFAVASLAALLEHDYKIVGVITAPDRKAGRGQKLKASAVKTYAQEKGLTVLQPTNLKSEEFIEELQSLEANLQVVVAFRMLPKVVWQMPALGTFNLHASLLPQYRGAAPIHWAVINGESTTGVTTFFIDDKIDTGEIIAQESTSISDTTTVGELHDKLMELGSALVVETVKQIEEGSVQRLKQTHEKDLKTAYKLNKDNTKIDWQLPLKQIYNKIRGLNPFPAAWCYLNNNEDNGIKVKLYNVDYTYEKHNKAIGLVIPDGHQLKIACTDGYLLIKRLQLPGKRKMDVKALLNGYQFNESARML